jgi:hypothetical protein
MVDIWAWAEERATARPAVAAAAARGNVVLDRSRLFMRTST